MMSFTSSNFWLALYMQEVSEYDALNVAVHLLPQVIAGIFWNIVAASILHKVNNTLIMALGSVAYVVANLLLTFQKSGTLYWAFIFPSLVLNVFGADFQFNVTNVHYHPYIYPWLVKIVADPLLDVCDAGAPSSPAVARRWHF